MSNSRLLFALVTLCSACGGSSFEAGGGGAGGDTSSAGAPSGGSGAESSAGAGDQSTGGAATAGAGGSSAAGDSSGGASTGGASAGAGTGGSHAGAGGSSGGASAGAGGSGGAADCATLKTEYAAALEKARVCDMGSTNQCDKSSTLPNIGCGCPTLVNAKSEATTLAKQKYQAFQNAKCPIGPICNIACLAYTSAACSAQTAGSGFVCTGSNAGVAN